MPAQQDPRRLLDGLAGQRLHAVVHDLDAGALELRAERTVLRFSGVRSSTLLGPWDGQPATVVSAQLVSEDGSLHAVELALRYPEVPRRYRIVARGIEERPGIPPPTPSS